VAALVGAVILAVAGPERTGQALAELARVARRAEVVG